MSSLMHYLDYQQKSTKENTILTTITEEINENNPNNLLAKFKDKFTIINNEEYYKDHGKLRKVIKNQDEKINLILKAHKVGHKGVFKTYNRLKRDYYWINMMLDVKYIVRTCDRSQLFRSQSFNNQTEDIATQPGLPFTKVGLDIVGPLPTTRKGNKYIIILVDYLKKWVEAEPTQNIDSITKYYNKYNNTQKKQKNYFIFYLFFSFIIIILLIIFIIIL